MAGCVQWQATRSCLEVKTCTEAKLIVHQNTPPLNQHCCPGFSTTTWAPAELGDEASKLGWDGQEWWHLVVFQAVHLGWQKELGVGWSTKVLGGPCCSVASPKLIVLCGYLAFCNPLPYTCSSLFQVSFCFCHWVQSLNAPPRVSRFHYTLSFEFWQLHQPWPPFMKIKYLHSSIDSGMDDPKFVWPADTPACKVYCNGRHCLKGPPPQNFLMSMQEVFDVGYETWIQKLVAWPWICLLGPRGGTLELTLGQPINDQSVFQLAWTVPRPLVRVSIIEIGHFTISQWRRNESFIEGIKVCRCILNMCFV